jgi:carboxyl-terminal processing protease
MNEQNQRRPAKAGRSAWPLLWLASTLVLGAVFFVASVPPAAADDAENRRYMQIVQNVFNFIQNHYVDEVEAKKLYEGAMKGMFEAIGDPHSVYLTESDMGDLNDTTQGSFGGVGLFINKPDGPAPDGTPPYVDVASPIEDTPGWRAGIAPGDQIVAIDGESTAELTMDQVLARLRGVPGTTVTLQIHRGDILDFPVTLTRAIIEVPTVKSAVIPGANGQADIGYLRISTFTPMTAERAVEALDAFKAKKCGAVIVDLRYNYGGLLQAAIGVADAFLDGGVVVSTKSRMAEKNAVYTARANTVAPADWPVVVLINRGSASASEIVAGALKDRGRAYLVGENSFGKGSVQEVYPIDQAGFKITVSRYYTPSDVNIDKVGIPPDLEVKLPALTDAQSEALNRLIAANAIPAFVKAEPNAGAARQEAFAAQLAAEYGLELTLLKRLVRDERNRTVIAPVYDLEYDIQLQAAVKVLRDGSYPDRLKSAKTLRQLQDAAALATADKAAASAAGAAGAAPAKP